MIRSTAPTRIGYSDMQVTPSGAMGCGHGNMPAERGIVARCVADRSSLFGTARVTLESVSWGWALRRTRRYPGAVAVIGAVSALAVGTASCGHGVVPGGGVGLKQAVYFRPVYCVLPFVVSRGLPPAPWPLSADSCSSERVADYASTPRVGDQSGVTVLLPDLDRDARFVLGPADLTSTDLVGVWVQSSGTGFGAVIGFTTGGAAQFDRVASARFSVYEKSPSSPAAAEAIDVNGEVVSFATLTSPDVDGCVEVVGPRQRGLSKTDASNLVDEIRVAANLQSQPSQPVCSRGPSSFTLVAEFSPSGTPTCPDSQLRGEHAVDTSRYDPCKGRYRRGAA